MAFGAFSHPDGYSLDVQSPLYPSTFLRSVMPIPCHSHNDQWRHTPLHAALGTGCISIEADIWASTQPNDDALFVGHDRGAMLPDRTLQKMYIQPLMNILALHNLDASSPDAKPEAKSGEKADIESEKKPNGVFVMSPLTSLTLLLDFKSNTDEILPSLQSAIQPLRQKDWLTYWDATLGKRIERPITIVASGSADFDLLLRGGNSSTNAPTDITRYVFYDAPLDDLVQPGDPDALPTDAAINIDLEHVSDSTARAKLRADMRSSQIYQYKYNPSNSHLASTSLANSIGAVSPILSHPDSAQRKVIRGQIRAARNRGLISRYWGTPRWPRGLRDSVWESLESEGVGLLSVDDLRGVRKGEWGRGAGGRFWDRAHEGRMGWMPKSDR
ncbi:MAG: hypothetical protein INR71_00115 [Terriglobus roseus]|nr:hypothetical protein [Terriglobus roseus]